MTPLLLLLSCSDFFVSGWSAWSPGLRGAPDCAIVSIEGDACLRLRATASQHEGNYAGFRLTITDQHGRNVWPGLFVSRASGGLPAFTVRVLQDHAGRGISSAGWWTTGMVCSSSGALEFYAAPGKVPLTESDRFYTDETGWTQVASFDGFFLQTATPEPWFFGAVELWSNIRPTLSVTGNPVTLTVSNGYPQESYALQRSTDLSSWQTITSLTSGDSFSDTMSAPAQFYRLEQ